MLEWIYPPNRIQALLASAAGEESWEPDYTTLEAPRIELYLRKINGEDVQLPEYPVTTIEKFLAYKCGEDVELPEPVTRLEMLLAKGTPVEPAELPEPQTMIEYYVLNMQAGGGVELTVTGNAPVTLANAIAHAIVSLTQEGKVTQASTPTPPAPKDIVCNNGTLKMVDDELPSGYKRVLGFTCDNNAMWQITGFNLKGSDTVRISFSVEAACNVWGCYQGTDATDNYDLYASVSAGSKYLRYGSGTYLSYFSAENLGQRFDVVYTPNGSQGMPQDSTWTPRTFTSANDLLIGSTTVGGTSSKLKGNLYGNIIVDGRLKLIPCERVSDNVLGYYDTYSETFYEPYEGYDGAVSLGYDGSHYHLETVGTAEVLTVTPTASSTQDGTPTPSDPVPIVSTKFGNTVLRAVGDVKDTYDPATQTITRRVAVIEMTGDETLSTSTAYGSAILITSAGALWGVDKNSTPLCTHFTGLAMISSGTAAENTCFFNASGHFYFRTSMSKTDFATFCAEAYAAGKPVTIYAPLLIPTTEAYAGGGLATIEDLFAVGDYKDEQDIITGSVTRKCGIWVLTGEENWTVASSNADVFYLSSTYFPDDYGVVSRFTPICSHLEGVLSTVSISAMTANTLKTNNSSKIIYACVGADYTKDEWKDFIAAQYAAGTPVIVLYPLAEETTEQVTPQTLHTAEGTNTVSVTSEVDPVTLTVVYKGTDDGNGSVSGDDDPGEVPFD